MGMQVSLTVNGESVTREAEPNQLLVHFIRDTRRLTGTHVGNDTTRCGACTVHVDGRAVKSDGTLHPMLAAFRACHGLQRGFCTPGMVVSAVDLVQHHGCHNEQQVREALEGNICRCTGDSNIVQAVQQGAAAMQS